MNATSLTNTHEKAWVSVPFFGLASNSDPVSGVFTRKPKRPSRKLATEIIACGAALSLATLALVSVKSEKATTVAGLVHVYMPKAAPGKIADRVSVRGMSDGAFLERKASLLPVFAVLSAGLPFSVESSAAAPARQLALNEHFVATSPEQVRVAAERTSPQEKVATVLPPPRPLTFASTAPPSHLPVTARGIKEPSRIPGLAPPAAAQVGNAASKKVAALKGALHDAATQLID